MFLKWCLVKLVEVVAVCLQVVLGKVGVAGKQAGERVDSL